MRTATSDLLARLTKLRPEPGTALSVLNTSAWAATEPRMLELCHLRVERMLGDERSLDVRVERGRQMGIEARKLADLDTWWRSPAFTAAERAHLAFTEQFVVSVSSVTDEDVDALLEHLDELEVYSFISALYVLELTARVERVGRVALPSKEDQDV